MNFCLAYFLLAIIFWASHVLFIGSDFDFNNPIVLLQKVIYIANEESSALFFFFFSVFDSPVSPAPRIWWCLIPAHFLITTWAVQYHSLIKTL